MTRRWALGAAAIWLVAIGCEDDAPSIAAPDGSDAGAAGAENPRETGGGGGHEDGGAGAANGPGTSAGAGGAPVVPATGGAGAGGDAGSAGGADTGDVYGRVKTGGRPAAGAVVLINGRSTVADDAGVFVLRDVTESYQLVVIDAEASVIKVYDELTTRTPILNLFAGVRRPDRSASVSGKLSGIAVPLPAANAGSVTFSNADVVALAQAKLTGSASAYSLPDIDWAGSDRTSGHLQALTWKTGSRAPQAFVGFARKELDIAHNDMLGPSSDTNLTLTDPPDLPIAGVLTLPPEFTVDSSTLVVGSARVPLQLDAGDFSLNVPDVDVPILLTTRVVGEDGGGAAAVFAPLPTVGSWTISPPPPPRLVLPVMDAQAVTTSTEFSFAGAPPETIVAFTWWVGDWAVTRVTPEANATLPDLTPQGIVYTNGFTNLWSVDGLGPASTVDAYLAIDDSLTRLDSESAFWAVSSEARQFTLAD